MLLNVITMSECLLVQLRTFVSTAYSGSYAELPFILIIVCGVFEVSVVLGWG
jgi:hypothetical protein